MKTKTSEKTADFNLSVRAKLIFDLTADELTERLRPAVEQLTAHAWSHGGYITYWNEFLCPDYRHMIREYADRKELVEIDHDGNATFKKFL